VSPHVARSCVAHPGQETTDNCHFHADNKAKLTCIRINVRTSIYTHGSSTEHYVICSWQCLRELAGTVRRRLRGRSGEAHGVDVRRGAAKLLHAVSLARLGRLRSVTFRHEQYISGVSTSELFGESDVRVLGCGSSAG
jgi:hypothetical protein